MFQSAAQTFQVNTQPAASLPYPISPQDFSSQNVSVYPGLAGYMGLELSEDVIRENMPEYLPENQAALLPRPSVSILIYFLSRKFGYKSLFPLGWIHFSRHLQYR